MRPDHSGLGGVCALKSLLVLLRKAIRSICLLAAFGAACALAATNVIEITYDAAGNITQLRRTPTSGLGITSFAPASGAVGDVVTIYGYGFSATPSANGVQFNGTAATVTASESGSISTTVPTGATTGRITVAVGGNTATSATDFVVTVPGAPTITSFTPTSGVATTSVSVTGTNFNTSATTVQLNGVTASSTITSATALSFTVPANVSSGRITATTANGTGLSAQDFIVPPTGVNAADIIAVVRITAGGPAANIAVGTPGKNGLILFDGAADTYYTMQFGQLALSPTNVAFTYKVIKPDNSVLATGSLGGASNRPTLHIPKLPTAGTYSVLVSPGVDTLNANVKVAADPVLSIDGASTTIVLDTASQSYRVVFNATANQHIGIGAMGTTTSPPTSGTAVTASAYQDDGTAISQVTLPTCYSATSGNPQGNCDGEFLAGAAGRYTLVFTAPLGYFFGTTVQLDSEVSGTLAADTPVNVSLARVGQDARFTFAATAGDSLGIGLAAIAPQPQAQTFNATIYKPDGTQFPSCGGLPPSGIYCELGAVPATGTYTVWVDPNFGAYGTLSLALKQGPTIATTDTPASFAPSAVAEVARFRFSGNAGDNRSVGVFNLAYVGSSSSATTLQVFRPDRTQVGNTASCNPTVVSGTCKLTLTNLPVTGTYDVVLAPPSGVKITGSINYSSDVTGALTSTAQTIATTRAGQNARYTFSGTSGDSTSLKLLGVTTSPASQNVSMTFFKPDGTFYTSGSLGAGNSSTLINLPSLPSTGTYTVVFDPAYGITWQGQGLIDAGTLMAVDGATATLTTTVAGEPLRYRFSATSGQRIEFGLNGLTYGAANSNATGVTLYKPDGTQYTSANCFTSGAGACEFLVSSAPSTGTYSIVAAPPAGVSITGGTMALSTALAGTFVIGDPAQTVAITRPGQTARYTFSGTSAQLLRLNWTSATVGSGATVNVSILKPDGTTLTSSSFINGASGGVDIASLPSTGTYTVVLDPTLAATMSAAVSLVTR